MANRFVEWRAGSVLILWGCMRWSARTTDQFRSWPMNIVRHSFVTEYFINSTMWHTAVRRCIVSSTTLASASRTKKTKKKMRPTLRSSSRLSFVPKFTQSPSIKFQRRTIDIEMSKLVVCLSHSRLPAPFLWCLLLLHPAVWRPAAAAAASSRCVVSVL